MGDHVLRDLFLNRASQEILAQVGRYAPTGKDGWRKVKLAGDLFLGIDALIRGTPEVHVHLLTSEAMPPSWEEQVGIAALPEHLRPYGIVPGVEDSGRVRYLGVEWKRISPDYAADFDLAAEFARWLASVALPTQPDGPRVPPPPRPPAGAAGKRNDRDRFPMRGWTEPLHAKAERSYYDQIRACIVEALRRGEADVIETAARYLLDKLVWGYTTVTDRAKYDQRYVSEGAKAVLEELNRASQERQHTRAWRQHGRILRHEHVHTRKEVVDRLLAGEAFDAVSPEACIVTEPEHRRLDRVDETGWERYRKAGIRVWDRQTGAWLA